MSQLEKDLIETAIRSLENKLDDTESYADNANIQGQILAYRRVLDLLNGAHEAFKIMNGL
jgi:hypothetical protein